MSLPISPSNNIRTIFSENSAAELHCEKTPEFPCALNQNPFRDQTANSLKIIGKGSDAIESVLNSSIFSMVRQRESEFILQAFNEHGNPPPLNENEKPCGSTGLAPAA